MRRLNNQDALLLAGEDTGWRLHIAALQLYDAGPGGPLDLARVRSLYRSRLPHLPTFRERLARVPADLGAPVWVESPDLRVEDHVHGHHLAAPGTDQQLGALVGELFARPIDLAGPLWDVAVVQGLENGRVAVLTRVHHSAVDGLRGLAVLSGVLDTDPDAPVDRPGEVPGAGAVAPAWGALLAGATLRIASSPVRLVRTGLEIAGAGARLMASLARGDLAGLTLPMTAARTSLNQVVSTRRELAFCSLPLAPFKGAARATGVTVNDAVLGLVGGALRRHLDARGDLPARPLVVGIPVGLADGAGGNQFAVITASLATHVADPAERLRAVATSVRAAKAAQQAIGPGPWQDLLDVPPLAIRAVARGYAGLHLAHRHPPLVNVVVSDMRGPDFPLYCAGARLAANYPIGPVADGLGLNVTAISYLDSLDVGLSVCPDLVPDAWSLVDALHAETAELARLFAG